MMSTLSAETVRVLLVDDHDVTVRGFKSYLEEDDALEFIGSCSRGEDVEDAIRDLTPDVVVLDLRLDGSQLQGVEVARQLRTAHGDQLKLLVISAYWDDSLVIQAFNAGINGYLIKTNARDSDVIAAIHGIMAGRDQYDPEISSVLREYMAAGRYPNSSVESLPGYELTPREWEVLEELSRHENVSDQEIADALTISKLTVKSHMSRILSKLSCPTRYHAATWYRLNQKHQPSRPK